MPITAEAPQEQEQRLQHAKNAVRSVLQVATPEELGRIGIDQTRIIALGEGLQAFIAGMPILDRNDSVEFRQGPDYVHVSTHRIGETDEGLARYQGREIVIISTGANFGGFELRIVPVFRYEALTQEVFTGSPSHETLREPVDQSKPAAVITDVCRELVDFDAEPGDNIRVGLRTFAENRYDTNNGPQVMDVVRDEIHYPIGRIPASIGQQDGALSGMVFIHDWRRGKSRRVMGCNPARPNPTSQGSGNHVIS
jgi:hypothetical protein